MKFLDLKTKTIKSFPEGVLKSIQDTVRCQYGDITSMSFFMAYYIDLSVEQYQE